MYKLIVYEADALVGYGFAIYYFTGEITRPDLYDIRGDPLPEGWYRLHITDEHFNVVVPWRIQ